MVTGSQVSLVCKVAPHSQPKLQPFPTASFTTLALEKQLVDVHHRDLRKWTQPLVVCEENAPKFIDKDRGIGRSPQHVSSWTWNHTTRGLDWLLWHWKISPNKQTLLGANSLALVRSFILSWRKGRRRRRIIRGPQVKAHSVGRGWQELMQQLLGAFLALLTILLIKLPFDVLTGSIGGNFQGHYGTPRDEGVVKTEREWSETTLNYRMMVERYPNFKEEVGGSIPGCETPSLPDGKLVRWVHCSCALAMACRPSC